MKFLDNKLKNFIGLSGLIISFFFLILLFFNYIYRYSTIITYNCMLLFLIYVTIILTLLFILSVIAVFYTYQKKQVKVSYIWLVKIGLNILLPIASSIIGFFNGSRDNIRSFYISVNNIIVQSRNLKFPQYGILVLLPHCLQDSDCEYKITNDIGNCRRCGKCCIGDISEISENLGVDAAVVTGGTAARNIVYKKRPKLILSVACERDLISGIMDVGSIPVIGLINDRPNGPCYNTIIDAKVFKERLESIIQNGN